MEVIKGTKKELYNWKKYSNRNKNSLNGCSNRVEMTEDRAGDLTNWQNDLWPGQVNRIYPTWIAERINSK